MDSLQEFDIGIINYWVLIPAACIIILLSFFERRKRRPELCNGHPALVVPFHFLDGFDNRVAYAMTFGTATSTVVSLITATSTLGFNLPLWAQALNVYLQATIGCLTCYPLFACLTTTYRVLGAILCILYSLLWLALKLVMVAQVLDLAGYFNSSYVPVDKSETIVQKIGQTCEALIHIPIILCFMVLIIRCFYILHKCYVTKTYFNKNLDSTVEEHQEDHVRWVLRKFTINHPTQEKERCSSHQTFVDKMKNSVKLRYFTNFSFFKYPTRMAALIFVQLNILYWAGLLLTLTTTHLLNWIINSDVLQIFLEQFEADLIIMISVCLGFALLVSILNALVNIFIGTRNYRYDLLNIYQGNITFVPVTDMTPQNILTRNMTFPGYQLAFILWGIVLCYTTTFLLTVIPVLCFYFTAKFDLLREMLSDLAQLLSFPASLLLMFYLLVFLAKRVLLQGKVKITDKDPPLNIDNRKFYEIISYNSLFTNTAVGLFTCLFRIIESAFFGIFFVARLDRSVFPHDLESWDRGYAAYVSMLLVDNAHNNPCMRVFAHLLWTKTLAARGIQDQDPEKASLVAPLIPKSRHVTYWTNRHADTNPFGSEHFENLKTFTETHELVRSSQRTTRWFLAYTLINNPQLCKLRKHKLKKDTGTN